MSLLGALIIGARQWLTPAVVIWVVALLLLLWAYARAGAQTRVKLIAAGLKITGFTLLLLCLLEPLWTGQRARPGANLVLIVADNSQSMKIRPADADSSPGDAFHKLLTDDRSDWQVRLRQDFEVRQYVFDSRVQNSSGFGELDFKGPASSLQTTLANLAQRYEGRPVAAVLLLTDGNATDQVDGQLDMHQLPPVFPVTLPEVAPARDVAVSNVAITQTNFEDAPVSLQADVAASGYDGQTIACQLLDPAGKLLEQQQVQLTADGPPPVFRFQFRPEHAGISFYRVRAAALDELSQFDDPDDSAEATLANNSRQVVVDRGAGPYRILYVSGRPNWEYKFLHRALQEDEQVELVSIIRIARREPKFDFRSRAGESTNPLFRGFGNETDEEAERYDQPVLIRLGTKNDDELRGGFPKADDQLFEYHAIVLDDLEAEFFTRDQMSLVSRFVSERGGGFLMLGGQESFQKGNYFRTPIGDLLPLYLDRGMDQGPTPQGGYRLNLTREGWLQTWVRLRANESDENQRLREMPGFVTLNRTASIKPGASILATLSDRHGQNFPALVAQQYGRGRSAAIAIGDLWRWRMRSPADTDDLDKAWRQMLRWLVADVPDRVELRAEVRRDEPSQPVRLVVAARDRKFQPLDNASVTFAVTQPDGKVQKLEAEPSLEKAGYYEASYVPRETGAYHAAATVIDAATVEVGTAEAGWTADPAADEFRSLAPNRSLLARLAGETGGELVPIDQLQSFAESLPNRKLPEVEQSVYPLWHTWWMFVLAVVCLAGEWGLRRVKGLP